MSYAKSYRKKVKQISIIILIVFICLFNIKVDAKENDRLVKINKAIENLNSNIPIKIEDAFSYISNIKNIRNSKLFDALKNAKAIIENLPDSYAYKYIVFDDWMGRAATYEKIIELIDMGLYENVIKISDKKIIKKLYSKLELNILKTDKFSIKKTICKILNRLNLSEYKISKNSELYNKIKPVILKYNKTTDILFKKKIVYDKIIIEPLYRYINVATAKIKYYRILNNHHLWWAGTREKISGNASLMEMVQFNEIIG